MADTLSFDDLIPKDERADGLTFDDLIPEDQRPKTGLLDRAIDFYRQPVEPKETAPGRAEPPPVGSDPMGDSAGQAIMRDAPMPEPAPERVRDSSVVSEQPYNDGKGNEGDPLRDLGLGAANAAGGNVFGDFYDPTGSNVVAGQFASKALTPFTMAGAKGMAGAVGDAARGIDVLVGLGTNGQTQFDWAKDLADWGSAQAKLVRGEVNSLKDVQGIGDFGTYLVERFGEGFGAFAPFFFGGPATAVGIGAVQGIGSTYNSLMEDKGIQDKLKSGELTEQDVRKISMIGGAVNGLVMGGVVKTVGRQSEFTKNFGRDLTRLALIDPGVFALSGGITTAANELLAGYFGGNAEVDERVARTLDATINGFFGGLPFGAVKVGGRIEARAQERAAAPPSQSIQAIPENGVAQETAAALSKDAGTAAASSDVDPTIQAATQADVRAKAKAAVEKVKAERAAEEAAAKEAAKASDDEKIKAGIEATRGKTLDETLTERSQQIEAALNEKFGKEPPTSGKTNFADTAIERLTKKGVELTDEQAAEVRARVEQGRTEGKNFGEILDGLYQDYGAAPKDAGITIPEGAPTLEIQLKDLADKNRNVMLFPSEGGKPADTSVAGERPKGVFEVVKPEGTYWYRTGRGGTSKEKIEAARQNPDSLAELLGYGPSKEEVAATKKPDETPLAAVERTDDGVEVKAAATNETLAPQTLEAVEANKGAPDRTVTLEPESNVIAGREAGTGKAPEAEAAAPAPAGAGPKAAPVVVRLKSRARKDKAPEAPKAETPPVTPEVTPEPQKPQGRVLRSVEQEAELERQRANADRGMRITTEGDNRDFGVAPDTSNPKARDRFTRRAIAAVKTMGDAAPQYYKDAAEAKAGQTKGRSAANMERTKKIDAAWQQEHEENLRVIERRKAAEEEAAKAAEAPEPETDARYEPKRDYTDEQIKRVIDEIAAQIPREKDRAAFLATEPEKLRLLAALELDRRKSDRSGGQSDVNDLQNAISLDENRTATRDDDVVDTYAKLKGEPVSIFDRLMARLEAADGERAKLAERLNAMTDEKFKNWIMRAEKGEFLQAVRAADEFNITRLKADEFRRLIDEIANEPIYPSREGTVREMFDENKLPPKEPNEKTSARDQLSAFIERRIMSLIGDMKVMVVDNDTIRRANIRSGRSDRIGGSYDPIKNHILLNEDYYVPGTAEGRALLIHEALHGVLANTLRRNKTLSEQITKLRDFVEKELQNNPELRAEFEGLDVKYGLKNADEFISEAWSNRDFQELLSRIEVSDAQLRAMNINPAQGWVRNVFRGMVELVRNALGTTPETRSALEEAIRYTDAGFEAREVLGKGAAKSGLTPREMAGVEAGMPVRPITVEKFAAKRGADAMIRRELESQGVDRATAEELVTVLREELGNDYNFKNAKPFIDELASNFRSDQTAPKPEAEIKAEATKLGEALIGADVFVPKKRFKAAWKTTLKLARVDQLAQMADRIFGRDTNPMRAVEETMQLQAREKDKILREFEPDLIELIQASHKFKGKGFEEMVAIALEASRAQVHPDVPLTDKMNAHLGQEKMSGVWGKSRHPDLSTRFQRLAEQSPELVQVYTKIRDMLPKMLDARIASVVDAVLRSVDIVDAAMAQRFIKGEATDADRARVGDIIAGHLEKNVKAARLKGPYFNFARRGDYVVHGRYQIEAPTNATKVNENTFDFADRKAAEQFVREQKLPTSLEIVRVDPKTGKTEVIDTDGTEIKLTAKDVDAEVRYRTTVQTQYTEFVDSLREARNKTEALREEGLRMSDPEDRKILEGNNGRDLLPSQVRALMETIDGRLGTSKLASQQKNEIVGILNEFALTMMSANRIQTTEMPRRNVAGMSTDFVRNTIEYMERSAGYMARANFQDRMNANLKDLNDRVKRLSDLGTGNGTMARRLANEMERRVSLSNTFEDPGLVGEFADRANTISYADKLFSLAYSMTNLTQVVNTYAELGGDHGAARSAFHILKAYNDVSAGKLLGRGAVETVKAAVGKDGNAPYIEQVKANLKNPKERELLDFLVERGVIDPDAGFEIQRFKKQRDTSGSVLSKVGVGADKGLEYLSNVARALPRSVEAVNRTAAALAAYRLELGRNEGNHEKAMRYAQDAVNNSQFNSSPTNVPPAFRNPYLRMPLQFKLFFQGSVHAVGRQVGRVLRNENPGDRVNGVRALAIYTASYAAMAGVLGLPGMELVKIALLLANALNLSDFKPSDFEKMVRRKMNDLVGKEAGEVITRGVTRAIPGGYAFDTSSRLGFPTMLFGEPRGDTEDAAWAYIAKSAAGAPASYGVDLIKGFRAAMNGEWQKAIELTVPIKTLSDYLRADRVGTEGKKNESGRQTMTPYTAQEKVVKTIGFAPAREAEENERRSAIGGDLARYNKERQKLIADWISNPDNRGKAMIAIQKFNRDKPKEAQIDMKDLRASEKRRKREEKSGVIVDGLRTSKRNRYLTEGGDIYNTRD